MHWMAERRSEKVRQQRDKPGFAGVDEVTKFRAECVELIPPFAQSVDLSGS